jgi:hypothetical protein
MAQWSCCASPVNLIGQTVEVHRFDGDRSGVPQNSVEAYQALIRRISGGNPACASVILTVAANNI